MKTTKFSRLILKAITWGMISTLIVNFISFLLELSKYSANENLNWLFSYGRFTINGELTGYEIVSSTAILSAISLVILILSDRERWIETKIKF